MFWFLGDKCIYIILTPASPFSPSDIYLACGFYTFEDAQVHKNPRQNQNKKKLPLDLSCFIYSTCLPQHSISLRR